VATLENIEIRVNGVEVTGLSFHRRMQQGYPTGPWDVSVEIPKLGYIELDDQPDFIIEIKDPTLEDDKRVWERKTLAQLMGLLKNFGAMDFGMGAR
jgi:hypothetical protein